MIKNGKNQYTRSVLTISIRKDVQNCCPTIAYMVGWQFRTSLRIEMVSTGLVYCFFTILYHLLDCKMVSDQF